jgi:hypothetical protein
VYPAVPFLNSIDKLCLAVRLMNFITTATGLLMSL